MRYEVFNVELNEGLEQSHLTGVDEDRFDSVCDHLIVGNLPFDNPERTERNWPANCTAKPWGLGKVSPLKESGVSVHCQTDGLAAAIR